jgi:hypothetical protein
MEHSLFMTTGAVAAHQNRQHTALDHLACGVVSIYILDIVARHRTYMMNIIEITRCTVAV